MRRTHMKSRITAMLLALVMVLQLVPAMAQPVVAEAAATAEQQVVYSLGSKTAASLTDASIGGNGWAINRTETTPALMDRIDAGIYNKDTNPGGYSWNPDYMSMDLKSNGVTIAFDIDVKEEGEYMLSVIHDNIRDFGGKYDVYLDGEFMGNFDADTVGESYEVGKGRTDTYEFKNMKLSQGTHTVEFKNVGAKLRRWFYLRQIVLTKIIDAQNIDFTSDANWSVNEDKTGDETLAAGFATDESGTKFNVANGETLALDFKVDVWGRFGITAIVDELAGQGIAGKVFIDGEYVGDIDTGTGTAQAVRKYIKIVELDAGVHTIEFNATIGKGDKILRIRELDITPRTPPEEKYFLGSKSATSLTDASIKENGWALNSEKTTPSVMDLINNGSYTWNVDHLNMNLGGKDRTIAFDIYVKEESEYMLSVIHGNVKEHGGKYNVYLDGELMGYFDADNLGDGEPNRIDTHEFKDKKLTSGQHTVEFKIVGAKKRFFFYLYEIILSPTADTKYAHTVDFCVDESAYNDVDLGYYGWALDSKNTSAAVTSNAATVPGTDGAVAALEAGEKVVFDINLPKGGNWSIDAAIKQLGDAGAKGIFAVDGTEIARIDCSAGSADATVKAGTATVTEGNHKASFTAETAGKLQLKSLTFTEANVEEYTVKFGNAVGNGGYSKFAVLDLFTHGIQANAEKTSETMSGRINNGDKDVGLYDNYNYMKVNFEEIGETLALDFIVPFDGKYKLDIYAHLQKSTGACVDIYIDDTYLDKFETNVWNDDENGVLKRNPVRPMELKAGKHTMYIRRVTPDNTSGRSSYQSILFQSLILTPIDALPTVKGVELSVGETAMFKGDTTEAVARVVMSVGSYLPINGIKNDGTPDENNFLKIESSATNKIGLEVIKPEPIKEKKAKITAIEGGSAVITASAKVDGVAYSDTVNVRCVELNDERTFDLIADKTFPIKTGNTSRVLLQGAVSGFMTDLGKAQSITFENSDPEVATVVINDTGENVYVDITGNKAGTATITVKALYDENLSDTEVIKVEVIDDYVAPATQIVRFGLASSYDEMNLDEHGLALNREKTDPVILTRPNTRIDLDQFLKVQLDKKGESLWLDFTVNADGNYSVDMSGKNCGNFGSVASFYIDGKYIGDMDFSFPGSSSDQDTVAISDHFRDIYLEKNKTHTLEIRRVDDFTSRHNYIWLSSMTLKPVVEPAKIAGLNINCLKTDKFLLGDVLDAEFSVRLSDGQNYFLSGLTENQGDFKVSGMRDDIASFENGKVYAKTPGEAVFEIAAEIEAGNAYAYWRPIVADGVLYNFKRSEKTDPDTATVGNDNWAVSNETEIDKNNAAYKLDTEGFGGTFKQNEILALTINVEKTGAYDVDMVTSRKSNLGMVGAFYIDDTYLGEFDFSHPDFDSEMTEAELAALADVQNIQLNSIYLGKGPHTFYVKRINGDASKYDQFWIERLVISNAKEMPSISKVNIISESDKIERNATAQIGAEVWMTNGRLQHFGLTRDGKVDAENTVKFTSSDPDVFTVDQTTGVMQGKEKGSATLTATATVTQNGTSDTKSDSKEFYVVRVLRLATDGTFMMERTNTVAAEITATIDQGDYDLTQLEAGDYEITYSDPKIAEAVIIKDKASKKFTIQITGKRVGEAVVTFTARTVDEDRVEAVLNIPVTVLVPDEGADDINLDFINSALSIPDAASISANGWKINYEKSGAYVVNRDPNNKNASYTMDATNGIKTNIQNEEKLTLDFLVKKAGNYGITFKGHQIANLGATVGIFIDDIYVGEFNFSHPSDTSDTTVTNLGFEVALNSTYLGLGEHTITILDIDGQKERHNSIYWNGVFFKLLDIGEITYDHVRAEAGKNILCVGEKTSFAAQAIMSDGSVRNMGNKINGKPDKKNYIDVKVDEEGKDYISYENGVITAIAPGSAKITVTGMVEGEAKTKDVTVTVDDHKLGSISASLEDDMFVGVTSQLALGAMSDGGAGGEPRAIDVDSVKFSFKSDAPAVATVDGTGLIKAVGKGKANITVMGSLNGVSAPEQVVTVTVENDGLVGITASAEPRLIRPDSEGTQISVTGGSYLGKELDLSHAKITYEVIENTYSDDADKGKDIITISESGKVLPNGILGESLVEVSVKVYDGDKIVFEGTDTVNIVVSNGKIRRSYYTEEKVANARENIKLYAWASSQAKTAIDNADKYIDKLDWIYDNITSQELPRSLNVGFRIDPMLPYCRYCGYDLRTNGGTSYGWLMDPVNSPWKLQCPDCRRKFPSNDFWSFYQLGIVTKEEYGTYKDINGENIPIGQWSYDKSHEKHYEKFAKEYAEHPEIPIETFEEYNKLRKENKRLPGVGYLKNDLYPEIDTVKTVNRGAGLYNTERVDSWAVDDGYGYKTGRIVKAKDGTKEVDIEEAQTYISAYNRRWLNTFVNDTVIGNAHLAYLYTGEAKYGRVVAILLDRIADVYPQMKIAPHFYSPRTGNKYYFDNSDSGRPYGRIEGRIWEYDAAKEWILGYDAVWPAYEEDEYVLNYLSNKSDEIGLSNPKNTPELLRDNIENNIIREIYKGIKDGDIYGNFGLHQYANALAAVVLDTEGETQEMLDYLFAKDEGDWDKVDHTGGDVYHRLYNQVDRDGGTVEGLAPNYTNLWYTSIGNVADAVNGYDGYKAADLYQNPKVQKMLENQIKLVQARRASVNTADSGTTAGLELYLPYNLRMIQCFAATGNKTIAQSLYFWNGNKVDGIKEDIFTKDPEKIQDKIQDVIDTYGEFPFDESNMYAGEGFVTLRDGSWYGKGTPSEKDTQRDFWMIFSHTMGHGHPDALNLGMHAYGLDFAPDLGYPTAADDSDEYKYWGQGGTLNHNLVVVNDSRQVTMASPGTPLHFDDADRVKVMDVSAPDAYSVTDEYRRTVVMVDVNDDVSYGVDFFRVIGGTNHLYSFHSQSHEATIKDVALEREEDTFPVSDEEKKAGRISNSYQGVYTGDIVPWRSQGFPTGYSYLFNVRRNDNPGVKEFEADFKVTDYRKILKDGKDLMLNVKMFNDFELDEITLTDGDNPYRGNNPEKFTYLFARRESKNGEQLDSTFTTVFQPYKKTPYIASSERVTDIKCTNGVHDDSNGDVVRVIKVNLEDPAIENGARTDYIIYASNNQAEYEIEGKLVFQGFLGFATYNNNELRYTYLNDGVTLKDKGDTICAIDAERNEYSANVINFTREPYDAEAGKFIFNNEIVIRPDEEVDLKEIIGRWMYIENDGISNGAYLIENARNVTADDIARHEGAQSGDVLIELGNVTLIRSASNVTATTGDYTYNIAPNQYVSIPLAESRDTAPNIAPIGDRSVVAGAKFTVEIVATSPLDKAVTLTAKDMPRGATFDPETRTVSWVPDNYQIGEHHFAIGASDGTLESTDHFTVTVHRSTLGSGGEGSGPSGDEGSGSGSGGGAGGGDTTQPEDTQPEDTKPEDTKPDDTETGKDEGEKFIDLGNHDWAKEAIYALVEKGVINGTSANTYSPASNIKRADFAIMLTRAFKITEGEGAQFADVDANKYYAEELRLAKSAGIVAGVGENKFNPEGEITRQDMMLMLYRALKAQGYELSEPDHSVLTQFTDAALIADYARDAVSVLVKDGIIAGSNGRINPKACATRAEIAVMLNRVIK